LKIKDILSRIKKMVRKKRVTRVVGAISISDEEYIS
jgi:hypothetical protein